MSSVLMILECALNRNNNLFAPRGMEALLPFRVNRFQYENPPPLFLW